MAKIIGAKIKENVTFKREDGTEGEVNSVEFRCVIKDVGADIVGGDVCRYSVAIEDLPEVFDVKEIKDVKQFCRGVLNRECYLDTKATAFGGKVTERLVGVTFKEGGKQ